MQSRAVVATRLRPRLATVVPGALGVWLAATAEDPAGALFVGVLFAFLGGLFLLGLPPETFRRALEAGKARRSVDLYTKTFTFGWLAPGFAWFGAVVAVVGAGRLLLG